MTARRHGVEAAKPKQGMNRTRNQELPNTTHVTLMERVHVIVPMMNDLFDAKPQKQ